MGEFIGILWVFIKLFVSLILCIIYWIFRCVLLKLVFGGIYRVRFNCSLIIRKYLILVFIMKMVSGICI